MPVWQRSDFSVRSESHFGQLLKLTKYTQLNPLAPEFLINSKKVTVSVTATTRGLRVTMFAVEKR
jgi:hypothetical protein